MHNLFSYGTLQLESIQLKVFGRTLDGQPDRLIGYKPGKIAIKEEAAATALGMTHYPVIIHTGDEGHVIDGVIFLVSEQELLHADVYEGDDYKRVFVSTESGKKVWVYVPANDD